MIAFPHAKINLGLHVVEKRPDGFHNIETVFYPIGWTDILEVVSARENEKSSITLSGISIAGCASDNLCLKAYHMLRSDFPHLPEIEIHLHKNIPMQAGLGGGSADAVFMLNLLNEAFGLHLHVDDILSYASRLGSDCGFFISGTPCFAIGKGDQMTPISLSLKKYSLLVVAPPVRVSTAEAYADICPQKPTTPLLDIIHLPITEWRGRLKNDFEDSVFAKYPVLSEWKQWFYDHGATYAAMSGSGSALFGLFPERLTAKTLHSLNGLKTYLEVATE